jgi:hypothetical protein
MKILLVAVFLFTVGVSLTYADSHFRAFACKDADFVGPDGAPLGIDYQTEVYDFSINQISESDFVLSISKDGESVQRLSLSLIDGDYHSGPIDTLRFPLKDVVITPPSEGKTTVSIEYLHATGERSVGQCSAQ